jgi:hypothetical protein
MGCEMAKMVDAIIDLPKMVSIGVAVLLG